MPIDFETQTLPSVPNLLTSITRIGRYELQAEIGRGGMGTVYKAYDPHIGRLVALKSIAIADPGGRARFQQEARIAGRLNHPHIVTVYDVGETGDLAYIVMELIEGQTLAGLLPSRLAWAEAVKLLLPVCQALDHAHRHNIIHRDVKPANILLAADGRVKLTDFGIARLDSGQGLTQTGMVVGTFLYMAPEQLAGETSDGRADMFALGAMLFELVAGQNPFAGDDKSPHLNLMARIRPPDFNLLNNLAPSALHAVIQQAMANSPSDRFTSMAELAQALTACLMEQNKPSEATFSPAVLPKIETGRDINLSAPEQQLLAQAFTDHDRLYIETELISPTHQARLLVGLPIRHGHALARVIIKLASPEILTREWRAYQEYVADVLPLITAHIQSAPLLSPDRRLALLRYTFSGDIGERQAVSLAAYYQHHSGTEATHLLRHLFQAVGLNWWLNRQAYLFLLGQEYDHLLPAHGVLARIDLADAAPLLFKAGVATAREAQRLAVGQVVQLQGFRVWSMRPEQQEMTLAAPGAGQNAGQLRFRLTGLTPAELRYQPGDLVPNFAGRVTATRPQLLVEAAQVGWPDTDLSGSTLNLAGHSFPNPLREYEQFLQQSVSGMKSTIHGGLTLESVLVEPGSKLTWLINFADTRTGHNLYDFLQFETQIVTRLLPPLLADLKDETDLVKLLQALHAVNPPSHAPHPALQKPYDLLLTIRHLAGQCMLDLYRWDEYYLGLVLMLLGALPASAQNPAAARLIIIWTAVVSSLVGQPLAPAVMVETPAPPPEKKFRYVWPVVGGLVGLVIIVAGLGLWFRPPPATPTPTAAALTLPSPSFTPLPTPTPPPTITPTPASGPVTGVLAGDLNVFAGPGTNHPFIGSVSKGIAVQVTGRDPGGVWWQIAYPEGPGGYGWVEAQFVRVEQTPVLPVTIASPPPTFTPTPTNTATPTHTPTPTSTFTPTPIPPTPTLSPTPTGSPTPAAAVPRQAVNDTPGYQFLLRSIGGQAMNSASFAPDGTQFAATEGVKLYTIAVDASAHHIWMEEDENIRPVEGIVWSPNGQNFAFVADRKRNCSPCRLVGIANLATQQIFWLEPPAGQAIGLPRWTQDGRLLVTLYRDDPAGGAVFIYDKLGRGQTAAGVYELSASHAGQHLYPWLPGKTWPVDPREPHRYYD